jgi:hypothetical protein
MKTVNITAAQPALRELVEEAYRGEDVVLSYGDKKVRLECYVPSGGAVDFDLEKDSPELEAELLKAVRGPFTPYSREDLEAIAERVCASPPAVRAIDLSD